MLQTPTAETCFERALAYEYAANRAEQPETVYFREDGKRFFTEVPTKLMPAPYGRFVDFFRGEADFWLKQAVLLS